VWVHRGCFCLILGLPYDACRKAGLRLSLDNICRTFARAISPFYYTVPLQSVLILHWWEKQYPGDFRNSNAEKYVSSDGQWSAMAGTLRVLYVGDEPDLPDTDRLFLWQSGDFFVAPVDPAPGASELIEKGPFDAAISGYPVPGKEGTAP
jgi:hypothetical protein